MQTKTYWNSMENKRFWLKMGVFTIRGTIIGMITDILADAYIYWEIEDWYFYNWLNQFTLKWGFLGY